MKDQKKFLELMTVSELVTEFKKGNRAAFTALYLKYRNEIFNFVFKNINDFESSEDVVQNTFLKVCERIETYAEAGNFKAWIFTIARNEMINVIRKHSSLRIIQLTESLSHTKPEFFESEDNAQNDLEKKELIDQLMFFVQSLNPNQRMVLSLTLEDLRYKEIAELLGMKLGTVKTSKHFGVKALKKMFKVA